MKIGQKITRVELKLDPDHSYCLFGIVTADPDYKLSLAINKKFNISLKNSTPVEIKSVSGVLRHFSRFSYNSPAHEYSYSLISNRSDNEVLLKKFNKIDFFFQVNSPEEEYETESIAALLKTVESIIAVFIIKPETIKDKNLGYLIH